MTSTLAESSSKCKKLRVRHSCTTQWIGKVNQNLSTVQKERINGTPFRYLMSLPDKINVSGILLEELARRWDKKRGGFRIRNRYVDFSPLDVCYAIGLGIVGQDVEFVDDLTSHTISLVGGRKTTLSGIYEKLITLTADEDVDDFCRLYILLGIEEFYFPNTSPGIHCGCIKLLDDINSLSTYNWGLAVYDNLVGNLNTLTTSLEQSNIPTSFYLSGCVVVMQVWGLEHVWPNQNISPNAGNLFPRCLKWQDVWLYKKSLLQAFEKNQVVYKLNATEEEFAIYEVRQALTEAPDGFVSSRQQSVEVQNLIIYNEQLEAEHNALDKRITRAERKLCELHNLPESEKEALEQQIKELQRELKEAKEARWQTPLFQGNMNEVADQQCTFNDLAGEKPIFNEQIINETAEDHHHHVESNMHTRRAKNPRNLKNSAAVRTPYETFGVSKKEKNRRK